MLDYQPARIIDAHSHIFPDAIADKATKSIGDFYDLPMHGIAGSVENLLQSGSRIGVGRYLVCSTATTAKQVVPINDFICAVCEKHPEFFGFATLHPGIGDPDAEVRRCKEMGLHGIKLHHDFQRFHIDDACAMPLYEAANAYSMPILFHMGDLRYDFTQPHRLRTIAQRFPSLVCMAAHFGGHQAWSEAYDALKLENVYFDTSSSLAWLTPEEARAFFRKMGYDRFFFGSDFPMWRHDEEMERVLRLDLTAGQFDGIFYQNFERLFEI